MDRQNERGDLYIEIPNWDGTDGFQHYKGRDPIWIKNYVKLLAKDEYLALSSHRRGVLHGIWLAYASSNRRLRGDARSISARLNIRVTSKDLEALSHAGFIEVIASKALAERLQAASDPLALTRARALAAEAEGERDLSTPSVVSATTNEDHDSIDSDEPGPPPDPQVNGLPVKHELEIQKLLAEIGSHADERTPAIVRHYADQVPEASLAKVLESLQRVPAKNRAAYAVAALKHEIDETS